MNNKNVKTDNVVGNIYETIDYEKFNLISGNRIVKLNQKQYRNLSQDIEKNGQLSPIIVDNNGGKLRVVDGQHRLKICIALKRPVEYILKNKSTPALIGLQNNRTSWKHADYIRFYSIEGGQSSDSYKMFETLMKKYKYKANTLSVILFGKELTEDFREGKMVINEQNINRLNKYVNQLKEIASVNNGIASKQLGATRSIKPLIELMGNDNYKHDVFLRQLLKYTKTNGGIPVMYNGTQARQKFLEIYNEGIRKDLKIKQS